jgi:hypothetical protein
MKGRIMRKLLIALVLALLAPASSFAEISVLGSYWDTEDAGETYGLGARIDFTLVPQQARFEISASYFEEFERTVIVEEMDLDIGFELEAIPIDLGFHLDIGRPGGFYVTLGGTYFLLDTSAGEIDDEVGYYGTLGLVLGRKAFLEVTYRDVDGTVQSLDFDELVPDLELSDELGVDLGGVGVNLGFRF